MPRVEQVVCRLGDGNYWPDSTRFRGTRQRDRHGCAWNDEFDIRRRRCTGLRSMDTSCSASLSWRRDVLVSLEAHALLTGKRPACRSSLSLRHLARCERRRQRERDCDSDAPDHARAHEIPRLQRTTDASIRSMNSPRTPIVRPVRGANPGRLRSVRPAGTRIQPSRDTRGH
jgi:hypothetical protein